MIKDLIEKNIIFENESNGWKTLKCKCCNDYKVRGGFKFEDNTIGYNCFNCGTKALYTEGELDMSHDMKQILRDFGIPEHDIEIELNKSFFKKIPKSKESKKSKCYFPSIELPEASYKLDLNEPDEWSLIAKEYMLSRCIDVSNGTWYLSKKFRTFIIIPFYYNNRLIYWQARNMDESSKMRYINCDAPKMNIMYGIDNIFKHIQSPLYVTEGFFDAYLVNGVALIGSSLTECKIELLNKTNREKVLVVDKYDNKNNGYKLAKKALSLGWNISYVEGSKTDINSAAQYYGVLWVLNNINKNIINGFEAKVFLETIKSFKK